MFCVSLFRLVTRADSPLRLPLLCMPIEGPSVALEKRRAHIPSCSAKGCFDAGPRSLCLERALIQNPLVQTRALAASLDNQREGIWCHRQAPADQTRVPIRTRVVRNWGVACVPERYNEAAFARIPPASKSGQRVATVPRGVPQCPRWFKRLPRHASGVARRQCRRGSVRCIGACRCDPRRLYQWPCCVQVAANVGLHNALREERLQQ